MDIEAVENNIAPCFSASKPLKSGLRLPGTWHLFESGVKAILGQQVSVMAASKLTTQLVNELGKSLDGKRLFPTPQAIVDSSLDFFKMPGARKQALKNLALHYLHHDDPDDITQWLSLKGIGPWTVDYAKLRGLSDPDIFLANDLGVKKAMEHQPSSCDPELASPWRSYFTFQLWNQLS